MAKEKLYETVVNIIVSELGLDEDAVEHIVYDEYLTNDPIYADSYDIDMVLMNIEDEFDVGLDIWEEDYNTLTIEDIVNKLEEALA